MTLTEIQNRIRTKRGEIAAEITEYDAYVDDGGLTRSQWRSEKQAWLDWLDGLLEGETT